MALRVCGGVGLWSGGGMELWGCGVVGLCSCVGMELCVVELYMSWVSLCICCVIMVCRYELM